jgi:hypothetical protein
MIIILPFLKTGFIIRLSFSLYSGFSTILDLSLKVSKVQKTEERILQVMKEANQPVSCDYIAFNLQIGWGTARGILLNMALKGRITALKTTKSFIFLLKESPK